MECRWHLDRMGRTDVPLAYGMGDLLGEENNHVRAGCKLGDDISHICHGICSRSCPMVHTGLDQIRSMVPLVRSIWVLGTG